MTTNVGAGEITLDDVLRHTVDGMFVIDRNRQVMLFSEGCRRITGADPASILGAPCVCHVLTECRDEQGRPLSGALCPSVSVFAGETASARQGMSIRHSDGRRVWIETTYSPVYDAGGEITYVVGVMRDIPGANDREDDLREASQRHVSPDPRGDLMAQNVTNTAYAQDDDSPWDSTSNMGPLDRILTTIEKREIVAALKRANGQRTLAARLLGISRSRLYRRMEALGIDPREVTTPAAGG